MDAPTISPPGSPCRSARMAEASRTNSVTGLFFGGFSAARSQQLAHEVDLRRNTPSDEISRLLHGGFPADDFQFAGVKSGEDALARRGVQGFGDFGGQEDAAVWPYAQPE